MFYKSIQGKSVLNVCSSLLIVRYTQQQSFRTPCVVKKQKS